MNQQSDGFVCAMEKICSNYEEDSEPLKQNLPWILVLIDGDVDEKETKTNSNTDQKDVMSIDKYLITIGNGHSYYLGGRLFALFINNTMKHIASIVEKLLKDVKKLIQFPLSIGMATLGHNMQNVIQQGSNINEREMQRHWVATAYANVLRAKEAGGNCFFNYEVCVVPIMPICYLLLLLFSF